MSDVIYFIIDIFHSGCECTCTLQTIDAAAAAHTVFARSSGRFKPGVRNASDMFALQLIKW